MIHDERPSNKWTQRSSGHRIGYDKHFTLPKHPKNGRFLQVWGASLSPRQWWWLHQQLQALRKSLGVSESLQFVHLDHPGSTSTIWQIFQATRSADVVKKGLEHLEDTSEQRNPQGILQPCAKGSGRENSNQHHNLVQVVSQQSPPCPLNMRLHDISFLKAIGLSVGKRQIRPNHCLSQLRPGHCGVQGVENDQRKNVSKCVEFQHANIT